MACRPYRGVQPVLAAGVFVDPAAVVIGDVTLGEDSSVWPMAVVRGDVNRIRIGARTNVQDGSVLHVIHDHPEVPGGYPLEIGDEVTVGHNVTLHGCRIGNRCLIGMGAVVLDGACVEEQALLAAGSLVSPGKVLEGGYLWRGSPARRVRPLTEKERAGFAYSAHHYVALKNDYIG